MATATAQGLHSIIGRHDLPPQRQAAPRRQCHHRHGPRLPRADKDHQRQQHTRHPLLGPATWNVGVIQGGVQVNFVPNEAVIEIDRRLLPGEEVETVLAYYQALLNGLMIEQPGLLAETETPPMLQDWAFQTDPDAPSVNLSRDILRGMGRDGSDASKFARLGIPTILFGPGSIDQAHAAVEYVECAEVEKALAFYAEVGRRFV